MKIVTQQEDRRLAGGLGGLAGRRRGFTMVEILTAIAIITILAAMFLIGFKYVSASSKGKKTQVQLETLRNMLNEFEIKGGRMRVIDEIYDNPPALKGQWTIGKREAAPVGKVTEERGLRTSDPNIKAVLDRTALVMLALTSVPQCKTLIDQMPKESKMVWNLKIGPPEGIDVPIILDAWNNPIIYAPRRVATRWVGSGAADLTSKPTDSDMRWGIDDGQTPPVKVFQPTDGKGLWVSAGPDEDFRLALPDGSAGDNVYSVEK